MTLPLDWFELRHRPNARGPKEEITLILRISVNGNELFNRYFYIDSCVRRQMHGIFESTVFRTIRICTTHL